MTGIKSEIKCPLCGQPCEENKEEVDVGPGFVTRIWGWDCQKCGFVDRCNNCSGAGGNHFPWCAPTGEPNVGK